jgi:phosphoribosyl 1,2-cyclic phosphodiesterase
VKARFWGVRGSIPVPGAETSRYGGNSSCIEVTARDGGALVLDAGTGARALGRDLLRRREGNVNVLFTHFHMDHLFGFPFFAPIYTPTCEVTVAVPAYSGVDAQNKLGRYLNGVFHPVRIGDVAARMRFEGVRPGRAFELGPFRIQGVSLNHPGGSIGYRVEVDGRVIVYLTDTAPLARPDEGLAADKPAPAPEARVVEAMRDADLVIMDTMFSWEEYMEKMTWGHSYPAYAARLAEEAGAKELVLFHHSPEAEDEELDRLGERWAQYEPLRVTMAREGRIVDLEG